MKSSECYFCNIIGGRIQADVVYEDETTIVIVSPDWIVKGYSWVAWKKHIVNISDIAKKEYLQFSSTVYKTEKVLLHLLHKDKSIILKSGGLEPHLHFHIYPVSQGLSWEEVKGIFDRKTIYTPTAQERLHLLQQFKEELAKL